MKEHLISTALAIALAASSVAYAQGRHDEKPHGMKKEAAVASNKDQSQATGGRHDEGSTSHGKKKAAKKASKQTSDSPAAK